MSQLRFRLWLSLPIMGFMVGLAIALSTFSWIGKPFPGFRYSTFEFVTSGGLPGWNGMKAELAPDDRITRVDGKPPSGRDDLRAYIQRVPPGQGVHYLIERGGGQLKATIAPQPFTLTDFLLTDFHFLCLGFLYILLGTFPFLKNPEDPLVRTHLIWATLLGVFFFCTIDDDSSKVVPGLFFVSMLLATVSTVHLALEFPRPFGWVAAIRPWFRTIGALSVTLALGVWGLFGYATLSAKAAYAPLFVDLQRVLLLGAAVSLVFFIGATAWKRFTSRERLVKQQCSTVLVGATLAFVPLLVTWLIPFGLGENDPVATFWFNFAIVAFAAFPAALGIAIVRYNLFDMNLIIKRTLTYAFTTGVALAGYFLLSAGLRAIFTVALGQSNDASSQAIATAAIALVFAPLRDRTRAVLDRIFDRTTFDYRQVVSAFTTAVSRSVDTAFVTRTFVEAVEAALHPRYTAVLLRAPEGPLKPHLTQGLGLAEVGRLLNEGPTDNELCLPLVVGETDVGQVVIGPRKSDQAYTSDDRQLLASLGQGLGMAVSYAQLFGQLAGQERLRRELEIATDVQMGLLPKEIPALHGALLSAVSAPALEVGGDFYDFVQIDAYRWGVIIGDVSGKGVPAALMMAVALSNFRAVAPGVPSPVSTLNRLNKLIHRNRPSNKMFVTALYCIYDARDGSVLIANAGQPMPLVDGQPVDIRGLPLGAAARTVYREARVVLGAESTLAMYSDGVEDMESEAEVPFGLSRTLDFFAAAGTTPPAQLESRLLETLRTYAGAMPAMDDMTVVLIQRQAGVGPVEVKTTRRIPVLDANQTRPLPSEPLLRTRPLEPGDTPASPG